MMRQGNIIFNIGSSIPFISDLDASKVIEAIRSTGVTITPAMRHAAHYLITNKKNIGTWQLSPAVYGMMGGTAAAHKWNWKDLRDVDAAFRLVFNGSFTHDSNGSKSNGGIADTWLSNANFTLNSTHLSFYSKTLAGDNGAEFGYGNFRFFLNYQGTSYADVYDTSSGRVSGLNNGNQGFFIANRSSSINNSIYKNGVLIAINTGSNSSTIPSFTSFGLFGRNSTSGAFDISNKICALSSIGAGLTDAQAIQDSEIVKNYQTILNRA